MKTFYPGMICLRQIAFAIEDLICLLCSQMNWMDFLVGFPLYWNVFPICLHIGAFLGGFSASLAMWFLERFAWHGWRFTRAHLHSGSGWVYLKYLNSYRCFRFQCQLWPNCLEKLVFKAVYNILQRMKFGRFWNHHFLKISYNIFCYPWSILPCDHVPPCWHRHFASGCLPF